MTRAPDADFAAMLEGVSRKELEARAGKISAAYRAGRTSAAVIADRMDALAYLVARFPATHAAAHAALRRVVEAMPQFSPASLLDAGAGPGTMASAARAVWPSLDAVTLLEPQCGVPQRWRRNYGPMQRSWRAGWAERFLSPIW